MVYVSAWGDPPGSIETEREARRRTLDENETVTTVGGRRARFEADSEPGAVAFVLEDGKAGPGGHYAFEPDQARVLARQLNDLVGDRLVSLGDVLAALRDYGPPERGGPLADFIEREFGGER